MKKILCIVVILMLFSNFLAARNDADSKLPLGIGFGLSEAADNLSLNLELSSPTFGRYNFQVRAESQLEYLSSFRNDPDLGWKMFSSHRLGLAAGSLKTGNAPIRLYGEFGGLCILPPDELSGDAYHLGIYALWGFEFIIENSPVSYYLEAGSNALFAEAEELTGSPDYYSGFTTRVGLRYYPQKAQWFQKSVR